VSTRPRPPIRALVVTAIAAVVAGLGVAALLIATRNGHHTARPAHYQRFRIGFADDLARQIHTEPLFFPDPLRGSRAFYLDIIDGEFVALHVVVPGTTHCVVQYARAAHGFRDCHRHVLPPDALERYPVTITGKSDAKVVEVDLRTVLLPLASTTTSR